MLMGVYFSHDAILFVSRCGLYTQREILRCHSIRWVLLEPQVWNGKGKSSTLFFLYHRLAEFTGE